MKRLLLSILLVGIGCWGQDGSLDETFGDSGWVIHNLGEGMETFSDVAENSSGQLFVSGYFDNVQGEYENFVLSFNEDGSLNTSFGDNGLLYSESQNFPSDEIKIQSDDKLLLKGYIPSNDRAIVRLLPNGTIDLDFGVNGMLTDFGANSYQLKFETLEDGKLLTMTEGTYSGVPHIVMRRFTYEGQLDASFGTNGEAKIPITDTASITLNTLNKLQEGAYVFYRKSLNENDVYELVKIHENGELNASFGIGGFTEVALDEDETNCKSLIFNDQSILVSCAFWDWQTEQFYRSMHKVLPSGAIDPAFNENSTNGYSGVIIQPNQRIISDGSLMDWEGGTIPIFRRHFSNGFPDYSFQFDTGGTGGGVVGPMKLIPLNSGKLLFAFSDVWYNYPDIEIVLVRLNNSPLEIIDYESQEITISPNPSDGVFHLKLDSFNQELKYSIADITGKRVQTGTIANQNTSFDLSSFEAGMYFLNLGNTTLKLIKN